MLKFLSTLFILALATVSCSSGGSDSTVSPSAEPFCETSTTYTGGITVSGTAVYEIRTGGNGNIDPTPHPIRQAEVVVYNSAGAIIQCGTTDDSGNFSVTVPNPATNFVLQVNSRISNSLTKAYVLNNPTDLDHHFIASAPFSGTSAVNLSTMTAPADDTLEGGAFNILDQILKANEYLRDETASCNSTFSSACIPFTGAPLVKAFWTKGVNPGIYINQGAISYYLKGESELYILGGFNGDVDDSDCDHFDNSIIIHEYGHFIEDLFSKTNSPGGTHNGDSIIDPRLAWGEGWADFFQAAVQGVPVYRDTVGNPEGLVAPSIYFDEDLENQENDIPTTAGEGNFREFSIARFLWDTIDGGSGPSSTDDDVGSGGDNIHGGPFAELWTTFTNTTNGFKYAGHHFRNMGLFHYIHDNLPGLVGSVQNWTQLRNNEMHRADQRDYARGVASSVGACTPATVSFQAANMPGISENGTAANSNQLASNDFYQIYHSGGTLNLGLSYTSGNPSVNLDIYVFYEDYRFSSSGTTIAAKATTSHATNVASATETISSSLPAGYYMVNIRANTAGGRLGTATTYTMTLNGVNLCPQ